MEFTRLIRCEQCGNQHPSNEKCKQCGHFSNGEQKIPLLKRERVNENNTGGAVYDVHPWIRYWARHIDLSIFMPVTVLIFYIFAPRLIILAKGSAILGLAYLSLITSTLLEAILLSSWGTTPGKWLLKITVRGKEGKKLKFSSAMSRSFNVLLSGVGLSIPLVALFTTLFAYKRLSTKGITAWDQRGGFVVSHKKIGVTRKVIAILLVGAIAVLQIVDDIGKINWVPPRP